MNYLDLIGPSLLPLLALSAAGCAILVIAQRASSSLRRFLAAAFLLSLVVVIGSNWIKVPSAPVVSVTHVEQAAVRVSTQARDAGPWPWLAFVPAVYAALRYIAGLIGLARARPRFLPGPARLTQDRLFVCPRARTAYAYGALKPTIVIPSAYLKLDSASLAAIIRHEEAHLRQGDPTLIPIVHLLQGLLWWNPFVHLLAHQWRVESERAADDAALASGIPPARYARQIIDLAQGLAGRPPLAGSAFVGRGRLKSRILAVLNPEIRRKTMKVSHRYLTIAGCTAVALALSVAASARWTSAQAVNEKAPEEEWIFEMVGGAAAPKGTGTAIGSPQFPPKVIRVNPQPQEEEIWEAVDEKGRKLKGQPEEIWEEVKGEPIDEVIEVEGRVLLNCEEIIGTIIEEDTPKGQDKKVSSNGWTLSRNPKHFTWTYEPQHKTWRYVPGKAGSVEWTLAPKGVKWNNVQPKPGRFEWRMLPSGLGDKVDNEICTDSIETFLSQELIGTIVEEGPVLTGIVTEEKPAPALTGRIVEEAPELIGVIVEK